MKKDFLINYSCYDKENKLLKTGTMRAKGKLNSFCAQVDFETWLKSSLPGFHKLVVHSCKEETIVDKLFGQDKKNNNPFGGIFGDIFK